MAGCAETCRNVYNSRKSALTGGVTLMLIAGTLYAYSLYAPAFKEDLHYSQTESSAIGATGDLGLYIGAPLGYFYDVKGPKATLLTAGVLLLVGYMGMLMSYTSPELFNSASPAWLVAVFFFIVGQGSMACYTSSIATNTQNFSHRYRGRITGLLASAFGLSSAVLSGIFQLFFVRRTVDDERVLNVSGFLFMLAIATPIIAFLNIIFVRLLPPDNEPSSIPQDEFSDTLQLTTIGSPSRHDGEEYNGTGPMPASLQLPTVTGRALLRSRLFYLHACVLFIGAGCGLMYINVMGSLSRALGGQKGDQNMLIVLYAVFNALSRIVVGFTSDRYRDRISRSTFLLGCIIVMGGSHASIAFLPRSMLPFGTIGVAIAYGGIFSMSPCIVSELFGTNALGFNWGMTTLASGFGGLTFGLIGGAVYDSQGEYVNGETVCHGHDCYRAAFLVNAFACAFGACVCMILIRAVRKRQERYVQGRMTARHTDDSFELQEDSMISDNALISPDGKTADPSVPALQGSEDSDTSCSVSSDEVDIGYGTPNRM